MFKINKYKFVFILLLLFFICSYHFFVFARNLPNTQRYYIEINTVYEAKNLPPGKYSLKTDGFIEDGVYYCSFVKNVFKDKIQTIKQDNNNKVIWNFTISQNNSFKTFSYRTVLLVSINPSLEIDKNKVKNIYPAEYKQYLQSDKYVNLNDPLLKQITSNIVKSQNPYEKLITLYRYVYTHMKYSQQSPIRNTGSFNAIRDILRGQQIINEQTNFYQTNNQRISVNKQLGGSCFDYATLLAAMLRLQNIPTRVVTGYAVSLDALQQNKKTIDITNNVHVWCEVYLHPYGWLIVDPTIDLKQIEPSVEVIGNNTMIYIRKMYNAVGDTMGISGVFANINDYNKAKKSINLDFKVYITSFNLAK